MAAVAAGIYVGGWALVRWLRSVGGVPIGYGGRAP
jgi:hypothetical protein